MNMEARQVLERADSSPKEESISTGSFRRTLLKHGLRLERRQTTTLQINVGLLCNQTCKHCHLEAGPKRTELMDEDTFNEVAAFAERTRFQTIDITGGAPELHSKLISMIERLSPLGDRVMVRSNLSALEGGNPVRFIDSFRRHRVVVWWSHSPLLTRHRQNHSGEKGSSIRALTHSSGSMLPAMEEKERDWNSTWSRTRPARFYLPHKPRPKKDSVWFFRKNGGSSLTTCSHLPTCPSEGFGSGFMNRATLRTTWNGSPQVLIRAWLKGSCVVRSCPWPGTGICMIVISIWQLHSLWPAGKPIYLRWRVCPSLGQESLWRTTATRAQPGQASHEPGLFRPEFRFSSRTLGFFSSGLANIFF